MYNKNHKMIYSFYIYKLTLIKTINPFSHVYKKISSKTTFHSFKNFELDIKIKSINNIVFYVYID